MKISIFGPISTLEQYLADVRAVRDAGFEAVWSPQIFGHDTLTAIALAAQAVPDIRFGTGVVPTYPRHPMALAAQARTVQAASGGRLTLGIGLSHQIVVESMWGMSFDKPAGHMREYLSILRPLLNGEQVAYTGQTLTFNGAVQTPDATPVPLLVAALGPVMLRLAREMSDGTVTWMVGAKTLESHIVPGIGDGKQVVCALPVAVTDDPDGAREIAAKQFAMYGGLPSYRAMLDREGAAGPADVAVVGSETEVADGIRRFFDAGATEFVAAPFTERDRTLELLAELRAG